MSSYFNEAGEPLMTAAQARFEADLDEQSMAESVYGDDEYLDYDRPCKVCNGWCWENEGACLDECGNCTHERHEHDFDGGRCYHGPSFYHPEEQRCLCPQFQEDDDT